MNLCFGFRTENTKKHWTQNCPNLRENLFRNKRIRRKICGNGTNASHTRKRAAVLASVNNTPGCFCAGMEAILDRASVYAWEWWFPRDFCNGAKLRRADQWSGESHIGYRKIPKISPGAYVFQRPFLRGLFLEGLIFGGAYLRREICVSNSIGLAL